MWHISASQSKNTVSTNIKHSRYIHLMSNILSIHFHTKRFYVHMFDIVDTLFSYGRGLIICSSLQEFSKTKESTPHVIWNVDTAFLLHWADMIVCRHTEQSKPPVTSHSMVNKCKIKSTIAAMPVCYSIILC